MRPSLEQGCGALIASHSAAGAHSLRGLELIWTQPACIWDGLGTATESSEQAANLEREAGKHVTTRRVAQR